MALDITRRLRRLDPQSGAEEDVRDPRRERRRQPVCERPGAGRPGRAEADATEIAATSSLNRLCHMPLFAYTVELTPDQVPYWGGETYTYFLAALVPRALWPEKPGAAFGNDFGHRYGILAPGVYDSSINLPWLVEFYVNFGPWAVPLGMALVGVVLRLLAQKLSNPAANDCEYVLGLTLCFQLFWGESNLAIMWGGWPFTSTIKESGLRRAISPRIRAII